MRWCVTCLANRADQYRDWLEAAGVEFSPVSEPWTWSDELTDTDAVLLGGGGDVAPRRYGRRDASHLAQHVNERRDELELRLGQYCLDHGIPLFGICRGLQVIQVLLEGRLIPDLGEQARTTHAPDQHGDRYHDVSLLEVSELRPALVGGKTEPGRRLVVNSAHHQAVDPDCLGAGLRVVAWSPDGVVEAVEGDGTSAVISAVQWHPERLPHSDPASRGLLRFWVSCVLRRSTSGR